MAKFKRHWLARLLGNIGVAHWRRSYPNLVYNGLNNLRKAANHNVTIVSSHSTMHDIATLDTICRKLHGEDRFPIFVKRQNIRYKLGPIVLSESLSHRIYDLFDGGGITVDQSDPRSLWKAMPDIKQAFEENKFVVLFPGATRHLGYVNGLFPKALQGYALLMKRAKIAHYFLPCGITYDKQAKRCECTFGELYASENPRQTAKDMTQIVCDFCHVDQGNIIDQQFVLDFIRQRQ